MSRAFVTKTSFTSGELDPLLLGRLDLRAQEDGAAKLRNVVVHPTGGVSRRPGLRLVRSLPGALRLIGFDGPDGGELIAFGAYRLDVIRGDEILTSFEDTLWGPAEVAELSCARWGDRLLLCHPAIPPYELVRHRDAPWQLQYWRYESNLEDSGYRRELQPFVKYAAPEVVLELNQGGTAAIEQGATVTIEASEPVFVEGHLGTILRVKGRDIRLFNIDPLNRRLAYGEALERFPDSKPTRDWVEQAFGEARGWPACVAVHQERLVIGGSRDQPDRLWFSKTGHPFNFDSGEGLDDEAISFRLVGDEQHAIRSLVPGRQLQVFTSSGEWVVRGVPVTPTTVQVELQTRIGAWAGRRLEPVDVDGATLFVGASGRELREFLYAESEQAYQAADIALLSRHLLADPMALAFDRRRRWLLVARSDGRLAAVTIDRNSNVVAWSLLESSGAVRSIAFHGGEPQLLVELDGQILLERFDEAAMTDHAVTLTSGAPKAVWAGLDHLEGREVTVRPDDAEPVQATVEGGAILLPAATTRVTVGTAYAHRVEPVPLVVPTGTGVSLDRPYRPVRITFRLLGTRTLRADTGSGPRRLEPGPAEGASDVAVRALGWRRGASEPPWRVSQDDPAPCTILSVTTEIKGDA
jgi:hypothetical protein